LEEVEAQVVQEMGRKPTWVVLVGMAPALPSSLVMYLRFKGRSRAMAWTLLMLGKWVEVQVEQADLS